MKPSTIFATILGTLGLSGPTSAEIVSYWSFDRDFSDATGAHDGIPAGGAAITTGTQGFGGSGEALSLSAEGDRVDTANPTGWNFNGDADYTWHAYIKTSDSSGAIFSRNPAGTAWNRGSKALFVRNSQVQWDTGWVGNPNSNTAVNDDQWHQVIATYVASTDRLNVFVDPPIRAVSGQYSGIHSANQFDETATDNGGEANTSFTIGQANFSGGLASLDTLIGLIDEVAVFDTALAGAELNQLIGQGPSSFVTIIPTLGIRLSITPAAAGYDLEWDSQAGMLYRLLSNSGLGAPINTWSIVAEDIPATPDTNTYNVDPADPTLFYAVEEYPAPPMEIFAENFDGTTPGSLPAGWTSGENNPPDVSSLTNWELGTPANVGPVPPGVPLPSGSNCVATNISGNYDDPVTDDAVPYTDIWLRSPSIDVSGTTVGSLKFQQWTEIEDVPGDFDYGSIRILDASDDSELAVLENRTIDGSTSGWEQYSKALPAAAFTATAGTIKIEWRFEADDIDSFAGWYIDDVMVTTP